MKNVFFYETEIGRIGLAGGDGVLTNVFFPGEEVVDATVEETDLLREAAAQLKEYLAGSRREFTIPLAPQGTEFMKRVWQQLREIPYGETRCYQEVAEAVGNRRSTRAVGLANNRNPIPLFIPCHRVIGKSGKLVGYRGGVGVKNRLIELESRYMAR